ncbi:MAG TPA: hypothetical protein VG796_27140 [Verrucomicrobiales bacterium]|nr:hypothetical protein [Verrucomicrobiales bacterium]
MSSGHTSFLLLRRNLLLLMLAVFVCGGLTGGAAGWFLASRQPAPPPSPPERKRPPAHSPEFLADALCRELEVAEQEREPIRTIFREVFADLRPVLAQRDAEVQSAFTRLRERITGMLNPAQQEKFTRIIEHVQNDPYHSKKESPRE